METKILIEILEEMILARQGEVFRKGEENNVLLALQTALDLCQKVKDGKLVEPLSEMEIRRIIAKEYNTNEVTEEQAHIAQDLAGKLSTPRLMEECPGLQEITVPKKEVDVTEDGILRIIASYQQPTVFKIPAIIADDFAKLAHSIIKYLRGE